MRSIPWQIDLKDIHLNVNKILKTFRIYYNYFSLSNWANMLDKVSLCPTIIIINKSKNGSKTGRSGGR